MADINHLNWTVLNNGAKSKAELKRRMNDLLTDIKTIED